MNVEEAQALLKDLGNLKTGWKTSEFWVTLVPAVAAILHVVGVNIGANSTDSAIIVCWGAVSAIYVAARTWLKSVHVGHAVNLSILLHNLEQDAKQGVTHIVEDPAVLPTLIQDILPKVGEPGAPAGGPSGPAGPTAV